MRVLPVRTTFLPRSQSGNMQAKQLEYLAEAEVAGIVLGARVPIVLTSRADKTLTQLSSCAQSEKQNLFAQTSQEISKLRAEAETEVARDRAVAEAQIINRGACNRRPNGSANSRQLLAVQHVDGAQNS